MSIEKNEIIPLEIDNRLLPEEISSFDEDLPSTFSVFSQQNKTKGNKPLSSLSNIEQQYNTSNDNTTIIFPLGQPFASQRNTEMKVHQFKPIKPDAAWTNEKGTFAYIHCQLITTFFYGTLNFSQFSNPFLIENDPRYELKFLYKGNNTDCEGTSFGLYDEFALNNISIKDLEDFIHALNKFFLDSKYISMTKSYQFQKTMFNIFYYLFWLVIAGTIGFLVYFIYSELVIRTDMSSSFWVVIGCCLGGVAGLVVGIILITLKLRRLRMLLLEEETILRCKNYQAIYRFIDEWNTKLFSLHKISMWIPISLNYVMFNLAKNESIQLISHSIDEVKTKKLF